MRKFDTKVQHLKYKVLREVARFAFEGNLTENLPLIPKIIIPTKEPTMRCCIYKERAILHERIHIAMGGDKKNKAIIQAISIACDECPMGGHEVSNACRGCIAKRCSDVCRVGAITFDKDQKAHIDKDKCVQCGKCAEVCPFTAIHNNKRPCESACKVNAITIDENKAAAIDDEKCISCGACVYRCPFGALMDKSYIVDVVEMIKGSNNGQEYNTYGIVAPSIATQFSYGKLGQVVSAIKSLGFTHVMEVALGADMVALKESVELAEKGKLTSSCCPAFVDYIEKSFPQAKEYISHNLSPMAELGKYIKEKDPTAKIIFIGPCTAKKAEFKKETVSPYIDSVITFEELQALFDAKHIEVTELPEDELNDASFYGRGFAKSGGLTGAVVRAVEELNIEGFQANPVVCSGIDQCKLALLKLSKNVLKENFIEGMACDGGCINGAGCLTHNVMSKAEQQVTTHAKEGFDSIKYATEHTKL